MIYRKKLANCVYWWPRRAVGVMMLWLMLSCAGCATGRGRLSASISTGPLGNSVLSTLPPGTMLQPPDPDVTAMLLSLFSGHLAISANPPGLRVLLPLRLATPSYLAERDAAEMELHRIIETLQTKP